MRSLPSSVTVRDQRRALLARGGWPRGAISIGSDTSGIAPTVLNANGNVVCANDVWTTGILSQTAGVPVPLFQRTNNDFFPYIAGALTIALGTPAPTALSISYALVSGTPISVYDVHVSLLVDAAILLIPIVLIGSKSQDAFAGAGQVPLIEILPATTQVNLLQTGSQAIFQLVAGTE